jgi:hypothetical protein
VTGAPQVTQITTTTLSPSIARHEVTMPQIVRFEDGGNAPTISYNVPEPITYNGRNFIEIRFAEKEEENDAYFNQDAFKVEPGQEPLPEGQLPPIITIGTVTEAMKNGFYDKKMFPHAAAFAGTLRLQEETKDGNVVGYKIVSSNIPLSNELMNLHPQEVYSSILAGKSLMLYRTAFGTLSYQYIVVGSKIPAKADIVSPGVPKDVQPIRIESPGDGAILYGMRPSYVVEVIGTYRVLEGAGLKVEVQIGAEDTFRTAKLEPISRDLTKWSLLGVIKNEGQKTITVRGSEASAGPQIYEASVNITASFSAPAPAVKMRKRLMLVEDYALETHLGQYGAGKVIKTFSLLPGEKTKISMRTYTRTETDAKRASSILDSVTEESAREFENSVGREQSNKKNYQESFSYEVNAKADASWGWGSAEVSGGVKGGSSTAREEFSKNISNALSKHAAKASSKRDVQVNTSYEEKREEEIETSIEREIQNINVSRTLNFVFRQMNQQFITVLRLFDMRAAIWDGNPDPNTSIRAEVPLSKVRSLLDKYIVNEKRKEVQEAIIDQASEIFDYQDQPIKDFILEDTIKLRNGEPAKDEEGNDIKYWRVNRKYTTTYGPDENGNKFDVNGIILGLNKEVMRTEGVIVDAVLGQGDGLDAYSHGLQDQSVREKELRNMLTNSEIEKMNQAIDIVKKEDQGASKIFETVFPCCKQPVYSLWPPKDKENDQESDIE